MSFAINVDSPAQSLSSHGTGYSRQNATASRCPLCHKPHDLEECETFKGKSVDERKSFLTDKFLCFGCYGENHLSRNCRRKRVCKKCKGTAPYVDARRRLLAKEKRTAQAPTKGTRVRRLKESTTHVLTSHRSVVETKISCCKQSFP